MRYLGGLAFCVVLAGCAGFSQNRLLEPETLRVATIAGATVLDGTRELRRSLGLDVACFGFERGVSRRQLEYQELMVPRMRGYIPRVVDGRECEHRNDREARVTYEGDPVMSFYVSPPEWETADIATVWVGMGFPDQRSASWEVRVQRMPGGEWYADDAFCRPGRKEFCYGIDPKVTGDGRRRGPGG